MDPTAEHVIASFEITNPTGGARPCEPIFISVPDDAGPGEFSARLAGGERRRVQILANAHAGEPGELRAVTVVDLPATVTPMRLDILAGGLPTDAGGGPEIREIDSIEADAFVRLDTGEFEIELCRGTGQGTTASKWGVRHFVSKRQSLDLIPSGDNSIGGFYAPFFTPENGLINPPEHLVADVEVIERGPVLHHYRMSGRIPNGLLPELHDKLFVIDWQFTAGTPWFERHYDVTDFATEVDGRATVNKFTVGDEFESGPGDVLFSRFASWAGTTYREGDPYAGILADKVHEITNGITEDSPAALQEYRRAIGGDITSANWDWYWRLFSAWESFLTHEEIERHLREVRALAHRAADAPTRLWQATDHPLGVEVPTTEEATVFVGPSNKTAAINADTGYAMVWWTSKAVGRFQIVQRRESGWSNWGTNGENECPELPTDVTIRTAYGAFAEQWRDVAFALEQEVVVAPHA